jgi:hypothetical protein
MKLIKIINYVIIVVLCILGVWYLWSEQTKYRANKKLIFEEYNTTKGWILDYDIIGDIRTKYLTYGYKVDSVYYERRVVCAQNYNECVEYTWLCDHIRFWVIYSTKDPSKSLIDLTLEIQDLKNPEFPEKLNNFK